MKVVHFTPFDIHYHEDRDILIVRYRIWRDRRWLQNGFWRFVLPVHEQDIFERAYIQTSADQVYMQLNFDCLSDDGLFYS